jgi:C1A family cysteine protease
MDSGYKYIKDNGVLPEEDYPYGGSKQICRNNTGKFKISGFTNVNGCV